MPISVRHSGRFNRLLGKLARKFPSAIAEVGNLTALLKQGERPGTLYRRLGSEVYRVRLPNRSAKRGKSAGFRVAYYVETETDILLLAICDRKDCAELEESNLRALMRSAGL